MNKFSFSLSSSNEQILPKNVHMMKSFFKRPHLFLESSLRLICVIILLLPAPMLSILAHFSSHFSQRVQATGACPWTDRHSQQKKWPFPQSTVCEILIMSLAVVDLSGTKLTSLAQPRI